MQRYSIFRLAPIITKTEIVFTRSLSKNANEQRVERMFNDQQAPYYTAKDVEFCPNRSKEIMQNNVKETSEKAVGNTDYVAEKKMCSTSTFEEEEHMKAYRAESSVNLHSVMQSNVPEPFNARNSSPTHLNMPGSSSSRDYKYLSGKMQTTHHSRQ